MTVSFRPNPTTARAIPKVGLRQVLPVLVGAVLLVVLIQRLGTLDRDMIFAAFHAISLRQWALSLLLSGLSFWAVAHYDLIAHRLLKSGLSERRALASGAAATALAQTIGLGAVTGTLARWKLGQPCLSSPPQALGITGIVTLGFLFGWAVVTTLAFAFLPSEGVPDWLVWAVLPVLALVAVAALISPKLTLWRWTVALPGWPILGRLVMWAAIDTLAAAAALYVLLPPDTIAFTVLIPAFLLALGTGIVSGIPLGIGAFELTLLTVLPQTGTPEAVAAIMGFRLSYYVVPAVLAVVYMICAPTPAVPVAPPAPRPSQRAIRHARDPLAALGLERGRRWIRHGEGGSHVVEGAHAVIAIGDPIGRTIDSLSALKQDAKRRMKVPAVYKASQAVRSELTGAGWWSIPISSEAILLSAAFDVSQRSHRQLRRKLRHAEKAQVQVAYDPAPCLDTLIPVAREWALARGGERGFSMGHVCASLLSKQHVFIATLAGEVVAFVSFHITDGAWMLDVVRHKNHVPDGTMHSLIVAAMDHAKAQGCARVSLDCVPAYLPDTRGVVARGAATAFARLPHSAGLLQFKQSFAPVWEPRFLVAPTPVALALAALDCWRGLKPQSFDPQAAHDLYAQDAFDT